MLRNFTVVEQCETIPLPCPFPSLSALARIVPTGQHTREDRRRDKRIPCPESRSRAPRLELRMRTADGYHPQHSLPLPSPISHAVYLLAPRLALLMALGRLVEQVDRIRTSLLLLGATTYHQGTRIVLHHFVAVLQYFFTFFFYFDVYIAQPPKRNRESKTK